MVTLGSLHDDTQDPRVVAQNLQNLDNFAIENLQEIIQTEKGLFGQTSLEVFARIDLGLILNEEKGRYEWMVNEVERMPNASLWILNKDEIDSDIPKLISKSLSDYILSPGMARIRYQVYQSQADRWWELPSIF